MGNLILQDILLIFLAAIPFIIALHYLRLPALIGFILTGALIGPSGLRLIEDPKRIEILAEIGVTLLLFSIGLEFSLASFTKFKSYVLKGGTVQIAGCIATGMLIGRLMNWPAYQGLYFGCVMALSSTAVVLTSLVTQRYHESLQGRIATGILILQDLAVIPMIVFLPTFGGKISGATAGISLLWNLGQVLLLLGFTYLFTRYLSSRILKTVSRTMSRELFLITVICFALGMAWVTNQMGLSFALGAFLGGLMIGSTDFRTEALSEIVPFRYCFNSLFFVSIGMLINFSFVRIHLPTVLLLVLMVPLLKVAITTAALVLSKAPLRVSLNVGIMLGQIGEFSFLLASLGKAARAIDGIVYQHIIAVASVTMLATPLFVRWSIPLAELIARLPGLKRLIRSGAETDIETETTFYKDHVIVCGFGPLGETLGHLLDEYKIPHVVLELNPETVEKTREKKKDIFFGDGTSEEILYRCGIERAKMLAITIPDFFNNVSSIRQARRLNPEIKIITRARIRSEAEALYDAGADIVVSEELEGGIEMGRYALKELAVPPDQVDAYIRKIRDFGSADFF